MSAPVATLSSSGWVKSTAEKLDSLLADFFLADELQSYLSQGMVSSYNKLLQETQNDITALISRTEQVLTSYLNVYFESVVVSAKTDANSLTNKSSAITLSIQAQVIDNGVSYSMGQVVKSLNGKVNDIMKLSNS